MEQRAAGGATSIVARLDRRTRIAKGEKVELVVDTDRLHFFDPTDGSCL